MSRPEFRHEAMATTFAIAIADQPLAYARQAAAAAFRELDLIESALSRYVESSDIACANRLACGESLAVGDDALQCLLLATEVCAATSRAFDVAYASGRAAHSAGDGPPFTLDPAAHTLTSRVERLHIDLGAVGKGYALDRLGELLREWDVGSALLQSGGSTVLALDPPRGEPGWPVGFGGPSAHISLPLANAAFSGSGTAVKGAHLIDPRTGAPAARTARAWALAPAAGLSDALSTAFFVMEERDIASFCANHAGIGAAVMSPHGKLLACGRLSKSEDAGDA